MAKVGAQRAAELTGKSKSTIQRAMNGGKISFELDNNGRRVIDVSELERAFGLKGETSSSNSESAATTSVAQELEKAQQMLENERFKMRIQMLEDQLEAAETQIDDLKAQRDQWQKQASQVLITSQHSQKEAEDLREELKAREERARARRQQRADKEHLTRRMQELQADNDTDTSSTVNPMANFKNFWKKSKTA